LSGKPNIKALISIAPHQEKWQMDADDENKRNNLVACVVKETKIFPHA
jgi:hypothetical protein